MQEVIERRRDERKYRKTGLYTRRLIFHKKKDYIEHNTNKRRKMVKQEEVLSYHQEDSVRVSTSSDVAVAVDVVDVVFQTK